MKPFCSGSRCLKGLSPLRRPSQFRFQGFQGQDNRLAWGRCCRLHVEARCGWAQGEPRTFRHISEHTLPVRCGAVGHDDPAPPPGCPPDAVPRDGGLEKSVPLKILLIVNNPPGTLSLLVIIFPVSKWCFSKLYLFDQADQGITAAFKAYCLRTTFAQAFAATEMMLRRH